MVEKNLLIKILLPSEKTKLEDYASACNGPQNPEDGVFIFF